METDLWPFGKPKLSIEEENEEYYFEKWKDESCGNYVGWILETSDFNIIVSRENPAKAGLYDLSKVESDVNSASDPFGEHPEWYKDRIRHLNIAQVAIKVINLLKEHYGEH